MITGTGAYKVNSISSVGQQRRVQKFVGVLANVKHRCSKVTLSQAARLHTSASSDSVDSYSSTLFSKGIVSGTISKKIAQITEALITKEQKV